MTEWLDEDEMAAWLPLIRIVHALPQALDTVVTRADVKNYAYHYAWTTHFREVTKER